jgi:hypothetical protein
MEVDYRLKIFGENAEYRPRQEFIQPLIKSDKKIFEITAGNGFGKTFLLNLFAYAFYADKLGNEAILRTLKDRVSDYSDLKAYNLEYKLSFNLPNGEKIHLSKESGTDRIVQYENGPPIGANNLHKTVSILYDVPVDPSLRLNEVIKDLGVWNNRLREKFVLYNNLLDKIENQFSSVRDDAKIKSYEKKAIELNEEKKAKLKSHSEREDLYNSLTIYTNLEKLVSDYKRLKSITSDLFIKEREFKSCPKPQKIDKKDENVIKNLQNELNGVKSQFKSLMLELITAITNHSELNDFVTNESSLYKAFSFLKENEIDAIINEEDYVDSTNNFLRKLNFLADGVLDFVNREESGKKYVVHNFLKQLLDQIDELIENGADGILEVLTKNNTNILKQEIQNRIVEHRVVNYSALKTLAKNTPNSINNSISKAIKLTANIAKESKKKGVDSDGEKYYKLKGEVEELKSREDKTSKIIERFRYSLADDLGISDTQLDSFEGAVSIKEVIKLKFPNDKVLDNLPDEINRVNREKQQLTQQIEEIDKSASLNEAMLLNEKKKITSQYSDVEQKKIRTFKYGLQLVIKNIGDFNELINDINDGDLEKFKEEEDVKFINVAGKIIAYSMDNKILRSDGNYIHLDYYDLMKKAFHCVGDVIIRKDDISTGLASANYLRQRIENVEGEYVVILLDEIGNMAKDTLAEVIKSIKKIEEQNRLIIAILTKPSANKEEIIIKEY